MSGPVRPPLTVTTASGTPSGRPITTIKVSDGDLTVSGNVATIDTSGSGGVPGGSTTEIQYNNAGAFAGDAGFVMQTIGAGTGTVVDIGGIRVGGSNYALVAKTLNTSLLIQPEGSGQLTISSGDVGGGTKTDMQVNVQKQATTDEAIIELKAGIGTIDIARIKLDGSSDLILDNSYNTDKDLDLKIGGTGQVEIENQTTDNDTTLSVKGNGTGDAKINLNNPSKAISLICDTNQKLKVQGGLNSFVFDSSSATGGITWPDGTTQITASSGVSFPLQGSAGSAMTPTYSFSTDTDTGIYRVGTNSLGFSTGGTENLRISSNGAFGFGGANYGTSSQVLTSAGSGAVPTWEDAGGGGGDNFPLPQGELSATYSYFNIGSAAPYGSNVSSVTARQDTYALNTRPRYYPFIAPFSAIPDTIHLIMDTAGTGTVCTAGIYTASSTDNYPDTLVATGTWDSTSTGAKSITNSMTTALVGGALYYYVLRTPDNGSGLVDSIKAELIPSVFPTWRVNINDVSTCLTGDNITSGTALPATAAYSSGNTSDTARPYVWLVSS